jgi:hypothetical protein
MPNVPRQPGADLTAKEVRRDQISQSRPRVTLLIFPAYGHSKHPGMFLAEGDISAKFPWTLQEVVTTTSTWAKFRESTIFYDVLSLGP